MNWIEKSLSIAAAAVVVLAFLGYQPANNNNSMKPAPDESSKRKPLLRRPLLPWRNPGDYTAEAAPVLDHPDFENHNSPAGEEPAVDFPEKEWIKNIGSEKGSHAGMCVFSAFEMMMLWHGVEEFRGFRNWCAHNYEGGGYPEKLDKLVTEYCRIKGLEKPLLIQYVGDKPGFLEQGLNNGWMPCCTLSHSSRYGPKPISHMVNCVQLSDKNGAIMDNNFKDFEWWTSKEACLAALKYTDPNNHRQVYWGVVVVAPGPPPAPKG